MKKIVENLSLDGERALYGSRGIKLINVKFDGVQDGESALKESCDVEAERCFLNLRYPFWHVRGLKIEKCEMTKNCRAAIWYSEDVTIAATEMLGIKAVRECKGVTISDSEISSPEFGWFSKGVSATNCRAESEYFLMRSQNINLDRVEFKGKYSFQYVKNALLSHCNLDTKDAFWHAKNVTIKDSYVKGEYLGWYSENLTFINCTIEGTQPLCYCKGLKLIGCKMKDCDLSFERSEAHAEVLTPIVSVKNFYKGRIYAPSVGEVIKDDARAKGVVICS